MKKESFNRFNKKMVGPNEEMDEYFGRNIVLTDDDNIRIIELLQIKEKLAKEKTKVDYLLMPLLEERDQLDNKMAEIDKRICGINGHVFDKKLVFNKKDKGDYYMCTLCHGLVAVGELGKNDSFIHETGKYKRILYKK